MPNHSASAEERSTVDSVSTIAVPAPLRSALALLHISKREAARAVFFGVLALGSSIALAATSAWLIARASQMPPVMQLSVATVSVRAFGVSRGVFRYLERLASHSVALKGMANLRTEIYGRLAAGRLDTISALRRGDLLARVSKDVDDVGDLVVRGLLPGIVAAILSAGSVAFVGAFHVGAAVALALCIVLAGVLAPWLAQRAAKQTELHGSQARADMSALSHEIVTQSAEITVAGTLTSRLQDLARIESRLADATDRSARMEGMAQGISTFALGASALLAAVLGIPAVVDGSLAPVELAVIVLTPLAVFEILQPLSAAAIQMHTSRQAATRIMTLLTAAQPGVVQTGTAQPTAFQPTAFQSGATIRNATTPEPGSNHRTQPESSEIRPAIHLTARKLATGWPGHTVLDGLDLDVSPGRTIALVGESGTGKTTTLMTLAGLLKPHAGQIQANGQNLAEIDHHELAKDVLFLSEDAHIFETTVYENLRVARANLTRTEAHQALEQAGLGAWLDQLPNSLDTVLGSNAATISGGERRRLLLARALCSTASVLLIDEPAEHLDPATADRLLTDLIAQGRARTTEGKPAGKFAGSRNARTVIIATHRLTPLHKTDEVLILQEGRITDRGTHAELTQRNRAYAQALAAEASTI